MDSKCTAGTVCAPSDNVVAREIEGEIVIVPLVAGIGDADDELYTLNETGRAGWTCLDGKKTLGEIASLLSKEYEADDGAISESVLGFASALVDRGILSVV